MILIFDLGGTNTRYALAGEERVGEVVRIQTEASRDGLESWLSAMHTTAGSTKLEAVVGGMVGQLVGQEGKLSVVPNLKEWWGQPVRRRMQEVFNCPVYILNDVEACGLGEAHDGAGTAEGVMAYFTVSSGVNAVRIVDGKVDDSIDQFELGQQLLVGSEGGEGTLESVIGGKATEDRFGIKPADIRDPQVWNGYESILARVVYNTDLYWTPDVIVFGGSMMRDIKVAAVEHEFRQLPVVRGKRPELVQARLGDLAGLHGALRWWGQHSQVA